MSIYHPQYPGKRALGIITSKNFQKRPYSKFKLKENHRFKLIKIASELLLTVDFLKSTRIQPVPPMISPESLILSTLARLKLREKKHMLGIFTRAEEVGFRGTLGVIYEKLLGQIIRLFL